MVTQSDSIGAHLAKVAIQIRRDSRAISQIFAIDHDCVWSRRLADNWNGVLKGSPSGLADTISKKSNNNSAVHGYTLHGVANHD